MTNYRFKKNLREHIKATYGTQANAAKPLGCSQTYISFVLNDNAKPTQAMLDALGVKRIIKTTVSYMEL